MCVCVCVCARARVCVCVCARARARVCWHCAQFEVYYSHIINFCCTQSTCGPQFITDRKQSAKRCQAAVSAMLTFSMARISNTKCQTQPIKPTCLLQPIALRSHTHFTIHCVTLCLLRSASVSNLFLDQLVGYDVTTSNPPHSSNSCFSHAFCMLYRFS